MEDYHIYEQIAEGKHAAVFKARKKRSLQFVAVKRLSREDMPRIRNTVAAMHSLRHINVCRFFSWYSTSKHVWVVNELCAGGDFATLLATDKRLHESAVRVFAADLVSALMYVHQQGVVMGEFRPAGILMDENGTLKLADFSFAQRVESPFLPTASQDAPTALQHTAPELLVLNAASAEAAAAEASGLLDPSNVTHDGRSVNEVYGGSDARAAAVMSRASDLYCLGTVLLTLLLGQPPFSVCDDGPSASASGGGASAGDRRADPLIRMLRSIAIDGDPLASPAVPDWHSSATGTGTGGPSTGPGAIPSYPTSLSSGRYHRAPYGGAHAAPGASTAAIVSPPRRGDRDRDRDRGAAVRSETTHAGRGRGTGTSSPSPSISLSPACHHLLSRLLDRDPLTRCSWPELLTHPWWAGPSMPSPASGGAPIAPAQVVLPDLAECDKLPPEPWFERYAAARAQAGDAKAADLEASFGHTSVDLHDATASASAMHPPVHTQPASMIPAPARTLR